LLNLVTNWHILLLRSAYSTQGCRVRKYIHVYMWMR